MMTCRVLSANQLPDSIKNEVDLEDNYRNYLVIEHNGKVINYASDGGEPEDSSFKRRYSWVKWFIEEAYKLGLEDGKKGDLQ